MKLSSNVAGDSNDQTNFPRRLLLTNTRVSKFCKSFANGSATDIKLSKTHLHEIVQLEGFLGRILEPLLKIGLPLIKNVLKPLAKSVLIPLGLTVATSATDSAIHKKMFGSGMKISLIISNQEINDIIKIGKSLENSCLLTKQVSEKIKNEV